jgi:hypothetical protein
MKKINDRIILGLIVGALGNIPKTLINEYFYRKGLEKRRFGDIVAGVFVPKRSLKSKKTTLFGLLGEMVVSSFLGIAYVYLISYTGRDHAVIKGWVTGLFGFGFFRGLLANVGIGHTYPRDVVTNAMMSGSSSVWGITSGFLITALGNEALFKPVNTVLSNPQEVISKNKEFHRNAADLPETYLH